MDPRVEPVPGVAAGVGEWLSLNDAGAVGVGLALADADEVAGAGDARVDEVALGVEVCGSGKVQAESNMAMLIPLNTVTPILKLPRVPMGLVCQAKSGLGSRWVAAPCPGFRFLTVWSTHPDLGKVDRPR